MRKVAFAAAVLLLPVLQGCGDRERSELSNAADTALGRAGEAVREATPETAGAPDSPREYAFEDRQDFAQSVRQQLAEVDQQVEELTAQAKSAGGAVSDRALANIRAARRAVDRNLGRVETATAANWEEIRRGVDEAVEHLDEAVERAYPK
ncbi:MAG TPA: hypothetical protein VFZ26_07080 [Gemmatimonadales bacterium]